MAEFAERIKPRAQYVDEAIELALANRWTEAVQVNRGIIDRFGPDEDTLNRLGKAYTELGQLDEGIEAYKGTLKMNPVNPIAVKIIVRETYQDPKFFGRPSFTIKKSRDEFRPYAKESLLTRAADVEEAEEDGEEPAEELDGMHTVDSAEDDVEVPEADEDTRKEDIY